MSDQSFKEKTLAILPDLKLITRKVKGQTLYGVLLKQRHVPEKLVTGLLENEDSAWEAAFKYFSTPPFQLGDSVVMHDCAEATLAKYDGKVWTCRTDAYLSSSNEWVVFLNGYSGYFDCSCLKKYEPVVA